MKESKLESTPIPPTFIICVELTSSKISICLSGSQVVSSCLKSLYRKIIVIKVDSECSDVNSSPLNANKGSVEGFEKIRL